MAHFGVSISEASDRVAALKILRRYSRQPLTKLRAVLGTDQIALEVSERDYPIELGIFKGTQHQHARFLRACDELRAAGLGIRLWYWVVAESANAPQGITEVMLHNLMAAHRESLEQEHD